MNKTSSSNNANLLLISLLLFFTLGCMNAPETPLVINDSASSYALVSSADYFTDFQNRSLSEIRHLPDSVWERVRSEHKHFGTGSEIIWLRIDIENNTDRQRWHIVSEYTFLDRITLYFYKPDKKLTISSGGAAIPISKRTIQHRLTVLPLQLISGKNRVWIRIESKFEKKIGLTLELPEEIAQRDRFLRNPYPEFMRLAAIIAIVGLLGALYLRNVLFLLYLAYLLSLAAYMGTWEGYALYYVYPENPGWNAHINYFTGYLFGFFLIQFWRRLLSLSVQLPWYNRIMNVLAWTIFTCGLYALMPFANFYFLDRMARVATLVVAASVFFANFRIVLMGQRYAIYSLLGCFFFFTSFCLFIFHGIWFIPGTSYMKNPMYLGFALEFIVLILSLLSRVRFINNIRDGKTTESDAGNRPLSRIQNFDLRDLVSALDSLMKEEKIFCDEDISLERLAGYLSITRHQLSELIREVYDTNFYGFINEWRISEAKGLLLEEKHRSILSIAMAVGYNSKSTFNQAFKKNTGITPTEFCNLNKQI